VGLRLANTLLVMARRICLIVNPSAGGGRAARALPAVERALRDSGAELRTASTRDLDHARGLADAAAAAGETTVTLGGDGLIGAVADALRAHPAAVLGIVPGGRGNDLARVLGIPADPVAACAVIAAGVERPLDLGEVGGRAFIGIASAGFDSDANRIANEAPARLGNLVYAYGALRALAAWRPARFEIELDPPGERHVFTGFSVAAANSRAYGGGMFLAPAAELDDGRLDVVVSESVSKARFLANLPRVFKGTHVKLPSVHVFRAAEVRIAADRPFVLYADGDPIGELPAVVRALPGAVRVLVPRDGGGALGA
jgi:YegS/Rv2252/BmrU family lipid kinase